MTHPRKDYEIVRPGFYEYLVIAAVILAGAIFVYQAIERPSAVAGPRELLAPMNMMFGLTAAVWLLMVIARNAAVLVGSASVGYFRDYKGAGAPDEWIERPARSFNNLMQVPMLFYVVALLAITLRTVDTTQIELAWIYVAARTAHAVIHILFNYVPLRFALYAVSCVVLAAMWARLGFAT